MLETEITPERLRQALALPGRSQTALALRLNLDPSAVNKIVHGRRQIKASELKTIRQYLSETAGEAGGYEYRLNATHGGAKSLFEAMRLAEGSDLRGVIATLTLQAVTSLRLALEPHVPFSTESQRKEFWDVVGRHFDALLLLGIGSGVLSQQSSARMKNLYGLANAAMDSDAAEVEQDSTVMRMLHLWAGDDAEQLSMDQLRSRLAIGATSLGLQMLKGSSEAVAALNETVKALERGILAID